MSQIDLRATWLYLRKNPVDAVAVVAGVVLVVRTLFASVPAPFPLLASVGELLWGLAQSYSVAWLFNLLVIVLPKRRDRAAVYATSARVVKGLAPGGIYIAKRIYETAGVEFPSNVPENYILRDVMKDLKIDGVQGNAEVFDSRTGATRPATWAESIRMIVNEADEAISRLEPVYSFYDAEAIRLIHRVAQNSLANTVRNKTYHLVAKEIGFFSTSNFILEYWKSCKELSDYYDEHLAKYSEPPRYS